MISAHTVILSLGIRHRAAVAVAVAVAGDAGDRGNLLLQFGLVGADQLVHLLPVLQEEERRGRPDVPRRAELLRDEINKDVGINS